MKHYFYSMVAIVLLFLCGISFSEASEPNKYWYKYTIECHFPNKVEAFKSDDVSTYTSYYILHEPKIIVDGRYLSTGKKVRVPMQACIVYEK